MSDYPSLSEQAGNALAAGVRVVAAAATGKPVLTDPAEHSRRLGLCWGCERFDHAQGRCRECGCFTSEKTALATERCPLGKW